MKIIDLMNKVANGENIPNKILYNGLKFYYNESIGDYENDISEAIEDDIWYLFDNPFGKKYDEYFNDEIVVCEEEDHDKKIMLEISNECEKCHLREKCIEKECVLFRIEKILSGDEY